MIIITDKNMPIYSKLKTQQGQEPPVSFANKAFQVFKEK